MLHCMSAIRWCGR